MRAAEDSYQVKSGPANLATRRARSAVTSRLRVPVPPVDVMARPRLFRVLDEAVDSGRVILVAGGAGSGKSVLLSSWLADRPRRAAWATLGRSDSDAHQLAGDLLAALQAALEGVPAAQTLMQLRPPPGFLDPERFADALIDALGRLTLEAPLVLVIDDVQHVGGSPPAVGGGGTRNGGSPPVVTGAVTGVRL